MSLPQDQRLPDLLPLGVVPHLLRVLPVVEEHGAVRIHPGNPVAAGQILCEIVRAILLYPMGDVLCQTLQLTGDPILEITVEHAHDQHQAGQQHCQGHAQDGAKDPFRHVSPALLSVHRADPASPSFWRRVRTWTSTVRLSPVKA